MLCFSENDGKEQDVHKFLKEALLMKDFDHKNILCLIGVALDKDGMPLVVLPYMRLGDLLSFIRNEDNVSVDQDNELLIIYFVLFFYI